MFGYVFAFKEGKKEVKMIEKDTAKIRPSQSSHFKVKSFTPKDAQDLFCGFLCLLFTNVYPKGRVHTLVFKV